MSAKKFLVTGFSGFVSEHFLDYLESIQVQADVLGIDIAPPSFTCDHYKHITCGFRKTDLLNKVDVRNIIAEFRPDYVLHLASYSSVAYSWKHPVESFTNNTNIFLNLIETIQTLDIPARILSIGSSEEYGNVDPSDLPLKEDHVLNPVSPYAVARVSQEMLSKVYVDSYGMDIIMTRSFNHIGTGQKDVFVIPSFAKKLVALKRSGDKKKVLTTGDTSIVRDFIDVRDVVEAYYLLFMKGKKGQVYNVCSGQGISLDEIIGHMCSILEIEVERQVDPSLVRPNDNRVIIGSNERIKNDTGWSNKITLRQSLEEIVRSFSPAEATTAIK
jgi:GDP-4-dehydro-6-deoxy-D-mannose reductase